MRNAFNMKGICPALGLLAASALCGSPCRAETAPAPRSAFAGSIREIPAPGTKHAAAISRSVLSAEENSAAITFEVALRMRNFDELQARIARGEQISRSEMAQKYFPLAADHDRLVQWLKSQGLEVTRTDDNRLAVFGRGPVNLVAEAFQVSFARVVAADGGEYTSAVTAPSLPAEISSPVLGIHGLQPHIRFHPLSTPRVSRQKLQANVTTSYLPAQIATAYGATGIGGASPGMGQTIALYELAFPANSDITAFWTLAGVTEAIGNITTVPVAGGPAASPGASELDEATLDTEWASALAPAAKIRIYGANINNPGENDEILQQVYADLPGNSGMNQLCICIGSNELEVEHDYLIIESQYMANLAAAGVSVLSASGDNGSYPDGILQVTTPTSDPDVTGVGGTTLSLTGSNTIFSETAWNSDGDATGGGVSAAFSRPSWQTGPGVPAGNMRCVPDVAATADPQMGAQIIIGGPPAQVAGGTSWATPIWTAFCALINQQRTGASLPPLGLLNPKLYPLIGSPSFHDVTTGNNGRYSATAGYDLCTGIGTPNLANLVMDALGQYPAVNVPAQLGNRVVTVGQPATFFVVGEGAPTLTYQWQRLPSGSSTWGNLSDGGAYSGSLTPTLVVSGTTYGMSGDQFQCVVSNGTGNATSTPVSLTVNATGVTTMAGWPGSAEVVNGTGWAARFASPGGIRVDASGNLFVSDGYSSTIRMVTQAGVVTTVAGLADMNGSTNGSTGVAEFDGPGGVAPDAAGDLFVADDGNYTIRKISGGMVTTLRRHHRDEGHVGKRILRSAEPLRRRRRQHLRRGRHGQ
jgi:kumamolisin